MSVDALQRALSDGVFARTDAPKKAAGRALGTLIELITFYLLRDWGLESSPTWASAVFGYAPNSTHHPNHLATPRRRSIYEPRTSRCSLILWPTQQFLVRQ